jgi:APA family basic amino acid/polyamine antiporter
MFLTCKNNSSSQSKPPSLFARNATGLVREFSPISLLFYGLTLLGYVFAFNYIVALAPLIGGSVLVGFLLYGALLFCIVLLYYCFMTGMPRCGGDYVFVSRILNPIVGFLGNFSYGILLLLYVAIGGITIVTTGFATLFGYLGVAFNNPAFLGLGITLSQPPWIYIAGLISIGIGALIALLATNRYIRIQNTVFIISTLGAATMLVTVLTTNHEAFVSLFNLFAYHYTGNSTDFYSRIISYASATGWSAPAGNPMYLGLLLFPVFAEAGFLNWNAQLAGEIRSPKKTAILAQLGGAVIAITFLAVMVLATYKLVGFNFISSLDYLLYNAPNKIPLPSYPYAILLIAIVANPIVALVIIVSSLLGLEMFVPTAYIYFSRGIFSYSFDKILPMFFSSVSNRTHSPVNAILAGTTLSVIFFVIVNLPLTSPYIYLLSSVTTWWVAIFPLFFVGLAAVMVSRVKPNIYSMLPIKGLALKAIGIIVMIMTTLLAYLMLTNSVYGANSPLGIEIVLGTTFALILVYVIARLRQGPILSLAFKELPPE